MAVESLLLTMNIARGGDRVIAQLPQVDPRTAINIFNHERYTLVSYIEEGTQEDAWFEIWEFNPDRPMEVLFDAQGRPTGLRREDDQWDLAYYNDGKFGHYEALQVLESIIMNLLKG